VLELGRRHGTLRYFADASGLPRASIERTQLPERAIRRYARARRAHVLFERSARHEGLMRVQTVSYFGGFLLERDRSIAPEPVPAGSSPTPRGARCRGTARPATRRTPIRHRSGAGAFERSDSTGGARAGG